MTASAHRECECELNMLADYVVCSVVRQQYECVSLADDPIAACFTLGPSVNGGNHGRLTIAEFHRVPMVLLIVVLSRLSAFNWLFCVVSSYYSRVYEQKKR